MILFYSLFKKKWQKEKRRTSQTVRLFAQKILFARSWTNRTDLPLFRLLLLFEFTFVELKLNS